MARKGDLKALGPVKHLNIGLPLDLWDDLNKAALFNERRLCEEARYAIKLYLKWRPSPAEEHVGAD